MARLSFWLAALTIVLALAAVVHAGLHIWQLRAMRSNAATLRAAMIAMTEAARASAEAATEAARTMADAARVPQDTNAKAWPHGRSKTKDAASGSEGGSLL